ncbi:MAG: DUF2891 domain-containing protein [Sphingobacterium sp.]|uniref:DUF2891 domain-containing protein n=1 Tax=Sphingobacterium sp. JB170 TaxID=1434842 RepID=UPI00097F2772|nr:DUF2891 domain-containing protein [Sphingobacterium sp. JB170]SJN48328.1 hypothetical protein FM107_16980 [Sphingobacterium sp. JB170]
MKKIINAKISIVFVAVVICFSCHSGSEKDITLNAEAKKLHIDIDRARRIIELPIHCLTLEYPNKLGQVIGGATDLKTPKSLRPIFYGCFDWHSSVHGYWSIVRLLKQFPALDRQGNVRDFLRAHITKENLAIELDFFNDKNNLSFERLYGWAWLFKLQQELLEWPDEDAKQWAEILEPLVNLLSKRTQVYLDKLVYPIRTGQHDNTAFSLSLMVEYAKSSEDIDLLNSINVNSARFFENDKSCSLSYEPSGSDFLSPCLEEAHLMSKIMEPQRYEKWLRAFLPSLFNGDFSSMQPALVSDRSDGKLVHLDGLNFSRAHCLYEISGKLPELKSILIPLANKHIKFSIDNISGDDYMGSHWLGTFALLSLGSSN